MSYELGRSCGEALADYRTGLASVESQIAGELAQERALLQGKIAVLEAKKDSLVRAEQGAQRRLEGLNSWRTSIEQRREAAPSEFSLVKGLLYISFSILLICADVSILGQVIARFLGHEWRSPKTGLSFPQELFTTPRAAFRHFPDLFFLILAILLIGFFIKVWKDWYAIRFDEERKARRIDRLKFVLYTALLLLSVASVGLMAAARLTIDVGKTSGLLPRVVSALLGLALPFVSAGFFMEGYDCLASRGLLWRLSLIGWMYRAPLFWAATHRRRDEAELDSQKLALSHIESSEHGRTLLTERQVAFMRGYHEGLLGLLSQQDGTSIYHKLRPLAIRRLLTRGLLPDEH